jgi:hypothetical protein
MGRKVNHLPFGNKAKEEEKAKHYKQKFFLGIHYFRSLIVTGRTLKKKGRIETF